MIQYIAPQFGKSPQGKRLERVRQSKHYKNGRFQPLDATPTISEEFSLTNFLKASWKSRKIEKAPKHKVASIKEDIKSLKNNQLIWFGHSSYLFKLENKIFMVDPVLSGSASPFSFSVKAFEGADIYSIEDFPTIDYLLITHDHYDHLDYKTVKNLEPKVKKVICGLGVGEHFELWKYPASKIEEIDWYESIVLENNIEITAAPVRHYSGRLFKRSQTLFCSFILKTPTKNMYIGGDTGYGTHLKQVGEQYGPFDFGIIECGQYNRMWKEIHMMPHDWANAVTDLKINKVLPVHFGKFKLALHHWLEPIELFEQEMKKIQIPMIRPEIGKIIDF